MMQKYLCCYGSPAWGALNRNKTEIISRTTDSSIGTQGWVGVVAGWGWVGVVAGWGWVVAGWGWVGVWWLGAIAPAVGADIGLLP